MDTHRLHAASDRRFGGERLGHPGLHIAALAAVIDPRRALDQQSRRLDLRRHVGQFQLDRLMLADRFAERLADLAVGDGFVERRLGDPNAARRDIDAPQFEAGERVLQAPALLPANQPVGRDFVIRKDQLGRVEPLIAELFEIFVDRKPRIFMYYDQDHAWITRQLDADIFDYDVIS